LLRWLWRKPYFQTSRQTNGHSRFIEKLAQQDIVEGNPDSTFRPEDAINRDEYAAIIRKAFDTDTERTIPGGSALSDVPENYWAAPAIEEAYETGFMGTPEPNEFNPQNEITRVNAILALVQGVEPQEPTTVSSATVATPTTPSPEKPIPSGAAARNALSSSDSDGVDSSYADVCTTSFRFRGSFAWGRH